MHDYQKMYFQPFNKLTDIIEKLRRVQNETENYYIREQEHLTVLKMKRDEIGKQ